jgi:hypothetical protein
LQKLWFVLLKERNMLATYRYLCMRGRADMHQPTRCGKVARSMDRLTTVIQERTKFHRRQLEIQKEAEQKVYAALGTKPYWLSMPFFPQLVPKSSRFRRVKKIEKSKLVPSGVDNNSTFVGGPGRRGGVKITGQWTKDDKYLLAHWRGPHDHLYSTTMMPRAPAHSQLTAPPQAQPSEQLPHWSRQWLKRPPRKARKYPRRKHNANRDPRRGLGCRSGVRIRY